jgi:hypothetical protein
MCAMVRRSTRWRSLPPKVLSLPTSVSVIECYAIEGKARHHWALRGEVSELLLVNAERETCWVRNAGGYGSPYECTGAPPGAWLVLGWRPCDRLPRERAGAFDSVDPELADLDGLQVLNPAPAAAPLGWQTPSMPPANAAADPA